LASKRAHNRAIIAAAKPKKRGKPKGKLAKDTPMRINLIAYCIVAGMLEYQIAKYWDRLTGDYAATTTIYSFITEHRDAIEGRETYLSGLSDSEREATCGLSDSQRKAVANMVSKRKAASLR